MHIAIRDSVFDDAQQIFELRCDPRLKAMQYRPSHSETARTIIAVSTPGARIPGNGWKCSTILADQRFAGHIIERYRSGTSEQAHAYLGWNLVPELWGRGFMVQALTTLFNQRFKENHGLQFIACCFASNVRCQRVIKKLGFQADDLTLVEYLNHLVKTWGRESILKFRVTYNQWCQRCVTEITKPGNNHLRQ